MSERVQAPAGRVVGGPARLRAALGGAWVWLRALPHTLWLAVGLALAARLAAALLVPRVIKWDEPDYLRLGYNLLHGAGFTTGLHPEVHYTPLFPIASGLSYLLVRDWEWAANLPYLLCGAALLLPVFALARRAYGTPTATVAALLLALFPPLVVGVLFWGTMTEPLYLLLVFGALASAWRLCELDAPGTPASRLRPALAVGALLGLAYLARPEATVTLATIVALVVALRLVLPADPAARRPWRATAATVALIVAAFAVVAAPYLVYLHSVTGQWNVTGKLGVTWAIGQAVIDADPAEYDAVTASLDSSGTEIIWFSPERFQTSLASLVAADPVGFARRVVANVRRWQELFFARTAFSHWLLLLVGVALFAAPWDRARLRRELFLGGAMLPIAAFFPFHVELRFFSPAFPILLIWVAHGLVLVGGWLAATRQRLLLEMARGRQARGDVALEILRDSKLQTPDFKLSALLLLFFLAMNLVAAREGMRVTKYGHKEAGLWLRAHAPADAAIMTRDLAVPLYAERQWVASPRADWPAFVAYARAHGADYLVVDRWEVTRVRPHLAFLLDGPLPPEIELLWQQADGAEGTRIFRFRTP